MIKENANDKEFYQRILSMTIQKIISFCILISSLIVMLILKDNSNKKVAVYSFVICIIILVLFSFPWICVYGVIIYHGRQIANKTKDQKHFYLALLDVSGIYHIFVILKDKENLKNLVF